MGTSEITERIKSKALTLGFDGCGIASSKRLTKQEIFLKNWLDKGLNASMHYMANHFDKRVDPSELVPGAKSVISVIHNYYQENQQADDVPLVAKYAYGKDYHKVLKSKLKALLRFLKEELPECTGRFFVDSAPVLDRAWAAEAGLGWIGKNTNLIVPDKGSFFFIGEIIVDVELKYDKPIEDFCGSCTKCINACPTNALIVPYVLDSNRCISYHTIENRAEIPPKLKNKFNNWVFGCDICQDVCPWNKFSMSTNEKQFEPKKDFTELTGEEWKSLDEESFNLLFNGTPLMRSGFSGIQRNLEFIK